MNAHARKNIISRPDLFKYRNIQLPCQKRKTKQNKTKQTKTKQQQQQKPITFLLFPRNCALHIQSRQKLITSQTALQDRSSLKLGIQGMSLQTMTPFKG